VGILSFFIFGKSRERAVLYLQIVWTRKGCTIEPSHGKNSSATGKLPVNSEHTSRLGSNGARSFKKKGQDEGSVRKAHELLNNLMTKKCCIICFN